MAFRQTYLFCTSVMLLISFIITYHNEPLPWLEECVRSVLLVAEELERVKGTPVAEIIVVDDGSHVSPRQMLLQINRQIRYVYQENAGLPAARNRGVEMAKGEYLQFVDADDALLPKRYSHIFLQAYELKIDMMMFDFTTLPCSAQWRESHYRIYSGELYMYKNNIRASACCYAFRKSLLGNLRFAEGLLHEDELFTPLLMLRMGKVCRVDIPAYYYRQRLSSITHSYTQEQVDRRLNDTHEILGRLLSSVDRLEGVEQKALKRRVEQLTADYIYNVWGLETDSRKRWERMKQLKKEQFLPLPIKDYTKKHWIFCMLTHLPFFMFDLLLRGVYVVERGK